MWFHLSRTEILHKFIAYSLKNLTTPMFVHIWIICSLLKEFELSLTKRIIQRRSRHRSYSHNFYIILLRYAYYYQENLRGPYRFWGFIKGFRLMLNRMDLWKERHYSEETQYLKEISNVNIFKAGWYLKYKIRKIKNINIISFLHTKNLEKSVDLRDKIICEVIPFFVDEMNY